MVSLLNSLNVEISCKTTCKSPCKSPAKFRAKLLFLTLARAKHLFPTTFSTFSHHLSHSHSVSVKHPTYPLFHNPYYYNYKIFI